MIVKVADLSDAVRRVTFSESAHSVNAMLAAGTDDVEQRFEASVDVEAEIYRHGTDVYFLGNLRSRVVNTCRRCAEEFEEPVAREFKFLIVKAGGGQDEELEDDTGLDHYEGDEIDLSPIVAEQALLALEGLPLCSEECKGLCAGCGANLNTETCTCARSHD
ncbi:MAG TPA: YceD family protein [Vicinamibacterales bacterium]|nr:YceD family protein [Vicinamibacterales bacterium]